jgi:FOG: WD40 repeat
LVNDLKFSPDGETIATASSDNTVKLWNLQGQLLHTLASHEDRVYSVAFSPDGQTIASGSYDKQ